jgi:hypothetical protein
MQVELSIFSSLFIFVDTNIGQISSLCLLLNINMCIDTDKGYTPLICSGIYLKMRVSALLLI